MIKLILLSYVLISGYFALVESQENECSAVLQNGEVVGFLNDTINPDRKVCAFLGIPYAQPPLGDLRFKPPQPAEKWNTTLNATSFPNWCPQSGNPPPGRNISENCLYLNVFQPVNASNLPVMIWFHGGSFTSGSSDQYTPTKLLAKGDAILVVVHYRLGVLGFFSTGDHVVPGNNGLKDQFFSIEWVHENIRAFGGNPDKVTIFGESAGGASVLYQYLSPLNKGLIHGVISQSGTPLPSWSIDTNPSESGKLVAKALGCPTLLKSLMVACMKQIPWEKIVLVQSLYVLASFKNLTQPTAGIVPVVEPKLPGAFISDEPLKILKTGDIPDIPVVIGANEQDGSLGLGALYLAKFGPEKLDQDANYMRYEIVPDILRFVNIHEDPANRMVASSVELAYLNGVNRSSWNESMPGLVDAITVFTFKSAVQHFADLLAERNRTVYLYSLGYHSNNSLWSMYFGANAENIPVEHGVTHGDDLMYLFDFPANLNEQDKMFSKLICGLWLHFGKHGNPTPVNDNTSFQWTPYNTASESYANLALPSKLQLGYRNSWRTSNY